MTPVATIPAAMMTAANLGARITGWGFIVFTIGSIAWSIVALGTGQQNLLWTNGFLTLVNIAGIWRWLGRQARYDDGAAAAMERSASAHAPSLFATGSLAGAEIQGADGEKIGRLVEGMMRCADLRLAYFVVSEGGAGGVGERLHAVAPDMLIFPDEGVTSRMMLAELQALPAIEVGEWPVRGAGQDSVSSVAAPGPGLRFGHHRSLEQTMARPRRGVGSHGEGNTVRAIEDDKPVFRTRVAGLRMWL